MSKKLKIGFVAENVGRHVREYLKSLGVKVRKRRNRSGYDAYIPEK